MKNKYLFLIPGVCTTFSCTYNATEKNKNLEFNEDQKPLSRSILMDIVPKKHRAKVNSIQTIAWGLFWNFSAVLGGYLVGDVRPFNFRLNFLVTAIIYVLGESFSRKARGLRWPP